MRIIQPNFVNIGHETVLFDTIIVREPDVNKNNDVHRYGPYWNRYYRLVNWPDNNNNNIDKLPANWLRLNIHRNVVATYMPIAPFLQHLDPCVINQHVSWMQYRLPTLNYNLNVNMNRNDFNSNLNNNIPILIMRVNRHSGWNAATPPHELETERVLDVETMLAQLQIRKEETKNGNNPQLDLLLDQVTKMLQLLQIQNNEELVTPQSPVKKKKNKTRKRGPAYERMVQNNKRLEMQLLVE